MKLDGLLEQLKLRGLTVKWQSGDTLLLCGPAKEKTPEVVAAVKMFKRELLAEYRPKEVAEPKAETFPNPGTGPVPEVPNAGV